MYKRLHPSRWLTGVGVLIWSLATAAQATVWNCDHLAGGICNSSTATTCTIGSVKTVLDGDLVDCSGVDVTINPAGGVKVIDGFFTFKADDLSVLGGGKMEANEGPALVVGGISVELTGSLNLWGAIRSNNNDGGGQITIDVAGNVTIQNDGTDGISANATSSENDGGDISIGSGGNVTIANPIRATGGAVDSFGGEVFVYAAGDIYTILDGTIDVTSTNFEAGVITLLADGNSTVQPTANGDITILANIDAYGKGTFGDGGEIEITAANGVTLLRALSVRGGVNVSGGDAFGGSVFITAGCGGVVIDADVDGRGGLGGGLVGPSLDILSLGDITLNTGRKIWSEATQAGGIGGDVILDSASDLIIQSNAQIDSNGDTGVAGGEGAWVELRGCNVSIAGNASIDAPGFDGGRIVVTAAEEPGDAPLQSGTQPLFINAVASLSAAGDATAGNDGEIKLVVYEQRLGVCEGSSPPLACTKDPDCTVGCSTVPCLDNNPDTEGVTSQFDVTPTSVGNSLLTGCLGQCQ